MTRRASSRTRGVAAEPPGRKTSRERSEVVARPMAWSLRAAIVIIVLTIVASASWRLFVGSDYVVTSPSMCPNICVGALVLDETAGPHLKVGELITFVPPGFTAVYTHRIVHVFADGSVETKGDAANIIDPWRIQPSMVRGRTILAVAGLGWFDLALPFLAFALTVILILRRMITTRHRREWDRLFVSLMVAVPIWLLKPLVRGIVVTTTTLRAGVSQIIVVNTGLLPTQFKVPQGQLMSFVAPGHRATLSGAVLRNGELALSQTASFHWWGWTIVFLLVCSPLLWYLVRLAHPSSFAERELVLRGRHVLDVAGSALAAVDPSITPPQTAPPRRDRSHPFIAN